jgi:transposase InsO family protein
MPWGSWSDLPTDLELWLAGLDVRLHHNRPRRCQENGRVERTHGVLARWVDPATCADTLALQERLDAASAFQRAELPVRRLAQQTRVAAYPAVAAGGRPFDPGNEDAVFDVARAYALLAAMGWSRVVDRVGRISLYNRSIGVGRAHAGQTVRVRFDPGAVAWRIQDARGHELAVRPAPELARDRILALTITHRRPPKPRRGAKPAALPEGG